MGIVNNFLIKSTRKGVKLALSLNKVTNNLKKLFSKINPFRDIDNMSNDQVLNRALGYAISNFDYDVMELLINAGANVNAIGGDGIRGIIGEYKRALAQEKAATLVQVREFFKDYQEKCCLMLGELITRGAMPKNNEERENILKIFEEGEGFDEFKEVVKLKLEASNVIPPKKPPRTFEYKSTEFMYAEVNPPKKPPRTFEYEPKNTDYDALLSKEPIYAKMYDSLEESGYLNISKESIYAEVYDSHKKSNKSLSLEDSVYFSVSEESIYCAADDLLEQKETTGQRSEPIYAKVDLSKKRIERKAKDIKANSGTYHGLVQDRVNEWQELMKLNEQSSSRLTNQQQTNNRKVETRAGFNVKEIKQKYESKDSGYESDAKVEQEPKIPNSKVNSVNVECGIEKGVCAIK